MASPLEVLRFNLKLEARTLPLCTSSSHRRRHVFHLKMMNLNTSCSGLLYSETRRPVQIMMTPGSPTASGTSFPARGQSRLPRSGCRRPNTEQRKPRHSDSDSDGAPSGRHGGTSAHSAAAAGRCAATAAPSGHWQVAGCPQARGPVGSGTMRAARRQLGRASKVPLAAGTGTCEERALANGARTHWQPQAAEFATVTRTGSAMIRKCPPVAAGMRTVTGRRFS